MRAGVLHRRHDLRVEEVPLARSLTIGIHSVRRAAIKSGDTVILLGVGAVGSFVCASLHGHDGEIIGMDADPRRLEIARILGATQVHLPERDVTPTQSDRHKCILTWLRLPSSQPVRELSG